MNAENAKTEFLVSHYPQALNQACDHFIARGNIEVLADLRRLVESTIEYLSVIKFLYRNITIYFIML